MAQHSNIFYNGVDGDLRPFHHLDPVDAGDKLGSAIQTVSGVRMAGDKARHVRSSVGLSPAGTVCVLYTP